ncbi:MAG: hypothetical protein R6U69_01175 [Marinobacter sp.]|uniref:hypothetical protein n=1 Tax=Marinobacter sp. TaxID=50741 RepID=UPI003568C87F
MRYLKTQIPVEDLLQLNDSGDASQLELPGIALSESDELAVALEVLEQEISRVQLSEEEMELLRRFRKTSVENRRMVLQILGG